MDTVKSSHPSTGPELGDTMAPEETACHRGERQQEEERETDTDTPDGFAVVTSASHRMAQEKHRYHTIGHQQLVTYGNNPKKSKGIDFSTVRGTSSSGRPRGALMQVFFSQNFAQEDRTVVAQGHLDSLKKVLDSFTADVTWKWGEGNTEDELNQSWTDIVASHASMSKTQKHQQEALWELLYTELAYINKLTVAKEVVLAALSHCHEHRLLQEIAPNMLFSNLPFILDAHRFFWQQVMYPMLQEVRLTGRPFDPLKLEAGCLQFPDLFHAYYEYCWEEDRNVEFTRRQLDTNPQFHTYISWVENLPQCGRMRLGDMQAKPHQRITKYPLLLNAILKNTEDLPTKHALQRMLKSVSHFVASINDYLQFKVDELALSTAAQRIEGYRIEGLSEEIDKHIREFCCFDLTSPVRGVGPKIIRKQLLEETLKVRGRKDNKELVVLLFTDVLLMTKTQKKSDKLKVVRPPLPLERIRCIELRDGYSFVLVEVGDLGCEVSVYSLSTPSPDSCSSWVSALREAKMSLEILRQNEANKTLGTTDDTELNGPPTQNKPPNEMKENSNGPSESDSDFSPPIVQQNGQSQSTHAGVVENKESALTESNELKTEVINNSKQWEEGEPSLKKFTERRVTWNHAPWVSSNSKDITKQDMLVKNQLNVSQTLLPDKHTEKNGILGQSTPRTDFSNELLINKMQHGRPVQLDSENGSQDQEIRRDSLYSQSGEDDTFSTEAGKFVRRLESPRMRRQRPNSLQPPVPFDSSRIGPSEKEPLGTITSDDNQRRASNASIKPQDTHRVLKLGSLKNNNGIFWHDTDKISSPDPQIISEPKKTPDIDLQTKPKLKTQRSISVTEISLSQASSLPTHRLDPSPPPAPDSLVQISPLQDLLQRAKQREKERRLGRGKAKVRTVSLQNSSAASTSPSLSASEGDRDAEESVVRSSAQRSTQDETKGSRVSEGMRVDWPGWCFDDEEVFDFQDFEDEDFFDQTLTSHELRKIGPKPSERHDGECSEV